MFVVFADKLVADAGNSTINGVMSSVFFKPEYLMRGWVVFGTVKSNWYDWLLCVVTFIFDGVVKIVDCNDDDEFAKDVNTFDCDVDTLLIVSIETILFAVKLALWAKALPVITILLIFYNET